MHNQESILKNETGKILWDFEMQTDRKISDRRPGLAIVYKTKRSCQIVDFAVPPDHGIKEAKKR